MSVFKEQPKIELFPCSSEMCLANVILFNKFDVSNCNLFT